MPNKILTLKRMLPRLNDKTFGWLQNEDGYPICATIERPWKDNQHDISCVPLGEYQIKKAFWQDKGEFYYKLQNVPGGREGIFIHRGNFWEDSKGCIILGVGFGFAPNQNGAMEFGVRSSGTAYLYFMDLMKDIEEAKLIITEA